MNVTQLTLLEQMRITELDIAARKQLLGFGSDDVNALENSMPVVASGLDSLVEEFYQAQTSNPEIASLIGDADTLMRLQCAQRRYILDLFTGVYGMEYVNNRLRIGLVHKRIGVEPRLYLSAVHLLRGLLVTRLSEQLPAGGQRDAALKALDKLICFDVTLVFETYIQSMVAEIQLMKNRTEEYVKALEETVARRTGELRTDALTGLTTRRYLLEVLQKSLHAAERRQEPLSVVFVDVDDFKGLNDRKGHAYGDRVLHELGQILLDTARGEDTCVRYGGDEFCIVLSNTSEEQAHSTFCERVRSRLKEALGEVTVSMGVVQTGPGHYADSESLLNQADQRMYGDKGEHKTTASP